MADSRPVLDLSSLPEGIPFPLDLDESSTGEVMVTQGMDGNGELAINIDVNIPRSFLSNGGELDFDINSEPFFLLAQHNTHALGLRSPRLQHKQF